MVDFYLKMFVYSQRIIQPDPSLQARFDWGEHPKSCSRPCAEETCLATGRLVEVVIFRLPRGSQEAVSSWKTILGTISITCMATCRPGSRWKNRKPPPFRCERVRIMTLFDETLQNGLVDSLKNAPKGQGSQKFGVFFAGCFMFQKSRLHLVKIQIPRHIYEDGWCVDVSFTWHWAWITNTRIHSTAEKTGVCQQQRSRCCWERIQFRYIIVSGYIIIYWGYPPPAIGGIHLHFPLLLGRG